MCTCYQSFCLDSYPSKVEKRLHALESTEDSLIVYYRSCSGCNRNASLVLIHKYSKGYIFEYFSWMIGENKLIKSFSSRKRSKYIDQLFRFISNNYDSLNKYNGYTDIGGEIRSKQLNDTATGNRIYLTEISHHPIVTYKIKLGNKTITSGVKWGNVKYYVDNAPTVGALLLLLNILHFENNYLNLLD